MFFLRWLTLFTCAVAVSNLCYAREVPKTAGEFGSNTHNNPFHGEGWVPRDLIPQEFIDELVPEVCQGTYLPVYAEFGVDDHLNIAADTVESRDAHYSVLSGNVEGTTRSIRFLSDKAIVDRNNHRIELYDNISFYLQDLVFKGDTAFYDTESGELRIDDVQYARGLSRTRIQTNLLARDAEGVFHLRDASYSTCEPNRNDWRVYGKKIDLNYVDGWGTITHAVIYIRDIPVFYFPWFRFPLDDRRHTGLLVPTIATANKNGLTVTQPIYLNLAPNYDATIIPTHFALRGLHINGEARLLTSYGSQSLYYGSIEDEIFKDSRTLTGFQHKGGNNLPWRTQIDYTKVSDPGYFRDLDLNFVSTTSKLLDQYGEVGIARGPVRVNLGWYDFQPVNFYSGTAYARLPGLQTSYAQHWDLFGIKTEGVYDVFHPRRLIPFTGAEVADGTSFVTTRRHATFTPGIYLRAPYGHFEAFTLQHYSEYSLDKEGERTSEIRRKVSSVVMRGNLIFDRNVTFSSADYNQTLEVEAQYLETQKVPQDDIPNFTTSEPKFNYSSIFALNRFKGIDRFGDTQQFSYGIATRILNAQSVDILRFQIGQIYYFTQRKVTLSPDDTDLRNSIRYTREFSPIAARSTVSLLHNLRLVNDLVWDQRVSKSLLNSVTLQKTIGARSFFTMGYNLSANEITIQDDTTIETEQLSGAGVIQITSHWAVFGRSFYDLHKKEFIERISGLEYESCCWRLTLGQFSRTNFDEENFPTETGAFIQFHLKGLSTFGSTGGKAKIGDINSALEKAIPGYTTRTLYLPD